MNEFVEKLKCVVKGNVVVYIDAANLEQSVKDMWVVPKDIPDDQKHLAAEDLRWSVDYKKLRDFWGEIGQHVQTRFYTADFASPTHRKFLYFLDKRLSFKLITKPLKQYLDHTADIPHREIKDITEQLRTVHIETVDTLLTIDRELYAKNPKKVLKEKNRQMNDAVKLLDFETAAILRDEIRALEGLTEK